MIERADTCEREPGLSVQRELFGDACVLTMRGQLCDVTIGVMEAQFDALGCISWDKLVLVVDGLRAVDEQGIRVLVGLRHYVEGREGELAIAGASGDVERALVGSPLGSLVESASRRDRH